MPECIRNPFFGVGGWCERYKKAVEIYKRFSDFYYPGFHINPNYVEESCETIEWMHKNGFRLIGELVPYMQGWSDYSNIKADFAVWK